MESFIRCTQVEYESTRVETFFDIQLNIKGKKNGNILCVIVICNGALNNSLVLSYHLYRMSNEITTKHTV